MRVLSPCAVLVLVLAGCAAPSGNSEPTATMDAPAGLHAICAADAVLPVDGTGICTQILAPWAGREREAHIAAHPTDPHKILITWRNNGPVVPEASVEAAFTSDAGGHWTFTTLDDPTLPPVPMSKSRNWDATTRFGPDGTGYILYGEYRYVTGPGMISAWPQMRMAIASTQDGRSWKYHSFHDIPVSSIGVADYMDLAIAPDTGRLIVVATVFERPPVWGGPMSLLDPLALLTQPEGIWAWTSDDKGATWSLPTIAAPGEAMGYTRGYHANPRVTAGPDGLVFLTTMMWRSIPDAQGLETTSYAGVTVSRDGGTTWGTPQPVYTYTTPDTVDAYHFNDPAAIWKDENGVHAALVYGDDRNVTGFRSDDFGSTWSAPQRLGQYPEGMRHAFLRAEARDEGVWASYRWGSDDPPRFGAGMLHWTSSGVHNMTVADVPLPGGPRFGDDYGAVAVAADGTAWMAFSDWETGAERVRVAHVGDRQ